MMGTNGPAPAATLTAAVLVVGLLAGADTATACGGGVLGLGQTTGGAGSLQRATGSAFAPGVPVRLSWHRASTRAGARVLRATRAGADGSFAVTVRIPATAPGEYVIEATQPVHNRSVLPGATGGALFQVGAAGALPARPAQSASPHAARPWGVATLIGFGVAALVLLGFGLAGAWPRLWRGSPPPVDPWDARAGWPAVAPAADGTGAEAEDPEAERPVLHV